jgi:hypothetical protein
MPDNLVVKSIHAGTGQEGYCVACMVCGANGPVTISISDAVNEYHKICGTLFGFTKGVSKICTLSQGHDGVHKELGK